MTLSNENVIVYCDSDSNVKCAQAIQNKSSLQNVTVMRVNLFIYNLTYGRSATWQLVAVQRNRRRQLGIGTTLFQEYFNATSLMSKIINSVDFVLN